MLTLYSIPKPFTGAFGLIQRNAVRSWRALPGDVQVVLVGDEEGVAEATRELGVEHVPEVARNEHGTPRLDDAFARVDVVARHGLRCFVNADIVLLDDVAPAVERVRAAGTPFLMVGRTIDLEVTEELDLAEPDVRRALAERARQEGVVRRPTAIDYFVFPAGLFDPLPPFVVGRPRFDNWLVWRARQVGPVVDASRAVAPVHQRHDYAHLSGGFAEAHFGEEGRRNYELAGATGTRMYTILDANRRLRRDGSLRPNPASFLRVGETLRKAAWKVRPH